MDNHVQSILLGLVIATAIFIVVDVLPILRRSERRRKAFAAKMMRAINADRFEDVRKDSGEVKP